MLAQEVVLASPCYYLPWKLHWGKAGGVADETVDWGQGVGWDWDPTLVPDPVPICSVLLGSAPPMHI